MTRSKGLGRGRAPGSRRALAEANVLRSLQAQKKSTEAQDAKPKAPPHLQPFQTSARMEELRARKAAKRPEAVAARLAQDEVERRDREEAAQAECLAQQVERQTREQAAQAEVERFAQEVEQHRNRPITILTASRWLGESPHTTLTRLLSGRGLRAVTMEDGSLRVRAADVERVIRIEAGGRQPVYHTPSARPCVADGLGLAVSEWAQIFGAAHPPYIVVPETVTDCPKCGRVVKAGYRGADGPVRFRCSTLPYCDYLAIAEGDGWAKPPEFIGPWSAPAPPRAWSSATWR